MKKNILIACFSDSECAITRKDKGYLTHEDIWNILDIMRFGWTKESFTYKENEVGLIEASLNGELWFKVSPDIFELL